MTTLLNILISFFVLLICWLLSQVVTNYSEQLDKRHRTAKFNPTMRLIIRRSGQIVIYLIGLLIIGKIWRIDIGPLWAGLGVAGVAIALGLQETLSNLFAALFVLLDKTIQVGAYLRLDDGTVAKVEDISWRSTRLKTASGEKIIMPNRLFTNQKVITYDEADRGWVLTLSAVAGPGSALKEVKAGALAAGLKVAKKYQKKVSPPQVYFEELTPAGLKFKMIIKIDKVTDEPLARHELLENLIMELNKRSCPLVGR